MPAAPELIAAFDAALRQVDRAVAADMRTRTGKPAREQLDRLRTELLARRDAAVETAAVDPDWVRDAVRGVVGWAPETELTLIAALGGIARANGRGRTG
jgi:hypothetical protein